MLNSRVGLVAAALQRLCEAAPTVRALNRILDNHEEGLRVLAAILTLEAHLDLALALLRPIFLVPEPLVSRLEIEAHLGG